MATPDYVLSEEYSHYKGSQNSIVLQAGSFVRPIEVCYLPKHITEDPDTAWSVSIGEKVFCYTRFGIIPIPKNLLRRK